MQARLFHNIKSLATLAPLAREKRSTKVELSDLGLLQDAWMAVDKNVLAFGQGQPPEKYKAFTQVDCHRGLVTPGLIDCHTHPIFAGTRAAEFAMRLNGATYQEIAAAGGGIKSTVKATRLASSAELERLTLERLHTFLRWGVTGCEVKTGYGLGAEAELTLLRVLSRCREKSPQSLSVTLLPLHAMPPGETDIAAYVKECTEILLPAAAKEKLADSVDAFVENGYFSVEDALPFLQRAKAMGFSVRLHADEFSDSGAATLAANLGAKSADHLQFASLEGIRAMAKANVVAVLLPGTSLYTKIPFTSGERFVENGCGVAVATDFNPGSSIFNNLNFIATLAALHCRLNLAQTLAAVTYVPAYSLGWEQSKGHLNEGADADFLVWSHSSLDDWIADFGRTPPKSVWIGGQQVATS